MHYQTRTIWKDRTKGEEPAPYHVHPLPATPICHPLREYRPESIEEIVQIVREAERLGVTVRAVGSGHSWSDVGVTTGFLIRPEGLTDVLPLDDSLLNDDIDLLYPFQVESGITIRQLNEELDERGLALPNMGGYDAQTIVGAASTSTHGSGLAFGPLCDMIRSLDLVGEGGRIYRIEKTRGITDPTEYNRRHPDRELIQDDDGFNAVVVSMGCMGVVYSVVLDVTRRFWLREVRTRSTWDAVRRDLLDGAVLKDNLHYEFLINPHETDGNHTCLVTTRNTTTEPDGLPPDKTRRNFFTELIASMGLIARLVAKFQREHPEISDETIDSVLEGLVDDSYINKSYKVLNVGVSNRIPAISAEIGFPLEGNRHIRGIERFLELAEENRSNGNLYHTGPVSVRFVKASDAFLSMMHGYDTCTLEIILAVDTHGAWEMLHRYESELYRVSGRPHWGQVNCLSGGHELLRCMYPKFDKWLEIHRQLAPRGTFDSPFARRVGLTRATFEAASAAPVV